MDEKPETERDMIGRNRFLVGSIVLMALVAGGTAGFAISAAYRSALAREHGSLEALTADVSARLAAQPTSELLWSTGPSTPSELPRVRIASRVGDRIVYPRGLGEERSAQDLPWDAEHEEPMRRALSGESGKIRSTDAEGESILVAYRAVPAPNGSDPRGVVAQVSVADIRAPFLQAAALATLPALFLALIGSLLGQRLAPPTLSAHDEEDAEQRASIARLDAEIRDRELAEDLTRENLMRTRAILDTAVDAIVTIDDRGIIESVNAAVTMMFGYAPDELIGRNVSLLMPEPYRTEHDDYLRTYLETGNPRIIGIGREVPCQRKNGTTFTGDLAVSQVQLSERVLFTGVMRDLTERKRVEQQLQEAKERVRAAEELASVGTLVAGLAHEIGTPMGVIQGHAKMLERHITDDRARWRLTTIQEQIGRISRIIQSLLNMARPKASERLPVALEPLLETTLSFLSEKFARRQIEVVRDFEPVGSVLGDFERLQQLLLNLFLNAVDAMPEGGELRIRLVPDEHAGLRLTVSDTGCGIPQENLTQIFEPFYTSKEAGTGNGLGLMVASRIVNDHGGSMEVESSVGEGTEFLIHIPWNPEEAEKRA